MTGPSFILLAEFREYPVEKVQQRNATFYAEIRRRTVRDFSDRPVPRTIIESCILAAGTAPNEANLQLWHFVPVSDPLVKPRIRVTTQN